MRRGSKAGFSDPDGSPSSASSPLFQRRHPRNDDLNSAEYRLLALRAYNDQQRRAAFAELGVASPSQIDASSPKRGSVLPPIGSASSPSRKHQQIRAAVALSNSLSDSSDAPAVTHSFLVADSTFESHIEKPTSVHLNAPSVAPPLANRTSLCVELLFQLLRPAPSIGTGTSLKSLRQQLRHILAENERLKLFVSLETPAKESDVDNAPTYETPLAHDVPSAAGAAVVPPSHLPSEAVGAAVPTEDSSPPTSTIVEQIDCATVDSSSALVPGSQVSAADAIAAPAQGVPSVAVGDPSVSDIEYLTSDNDVTVVPPSSEFVASAPVPERNKATDSEPVTDMDSSALSSELHRQRQFNLTLKKQASQFLQLQLNASAGVNRVGSAAASMLLSVLSSDVAATVNMAVPGPLVMVQKLEEQNKHLQQLALIRAQNASVRRQELNVGKLPAVHTQILFSEELGAALAAQAAASDITDIISSQREQLFSSLMARTVDATENPPVINSLLGSGLTIRQAEERLAMLRRQNALLRQQASVALGVFPRQLKVRERPNASESETSRSDSSEISSGLFGSSSEDQQSRKIRGKSKSNRMRALLAPKDGSWTLQSQQSPLVTVEEEPAASADAKSSRASSAHSRPKSGSRSRPRSGGSHAPAVQPLPPASLKLQQLQALLDSQQQASVQKEASFRAQKNAQSAVSLTGFADARSVPVISLSRDEMFAKAAEDADAASRRIEIAARRARTFYKKKFTQFMSMIKDGLQKQKTATDLMEAARRQAVVQDAPTPGGIATSGIFRDTPSEKQEPTNSSLGSFPGYSIYMDMKAEGEALLDEAEDEANALRTRFHDNIFDQRVIPRVIHFFLSSGIAALQFYLQGVRAKSRDGSQRMKRLDAAGVACAYGPGTLWASSSSMSVSNAARGAARHLARIVAWITEAAQLLRVAHASRDGGGLERENADGFVAMANRNARVLRDRLRFDDWGGRKRGRTGWDELELHVRTMAASEQPVAVMWAQGLLDIQVARISDVCTQIDQYYTKAQSVIAEYNATQNRPLAHRNMAIIEMEGYFEKMKEAQTHIMLLNNDLAEMREAVKVLQFDASLLPMHAREMLGYAEDEIHLDEAKQWWRERRQPLRVHLSSLHQLWSRGASNLELCNVSHEVDVINAKILANRLKMRKSLGMVGVAQETLRSEAERAFEAIEREGQALRNSVRSLVSEKKMDISRMASHARAFIMNDESAERLWEIGITDSVIRRLQDELLELVNLALAANSDQELSDVEVKAAQFRNKLLRGSNLAPQWRLPPNLKNFLSMYRLPGQRGGYSLRELIDSGLIDPEICSMLKDAEQIKDSVLRGLDYIRQANAAGDGNSAAALVAEWTFEASRQHCHLLRKNVDVLLQSGKRLPKLLQDFISSKEDIVALVKNGMFEIPKPSTPANDGRILEQQLASVSKALGEDLNNMSSDVKSSKLLSYLLRVKALGQMDTAAAKAAMVALSIIDPDLIPDDIKDYLPQERPGTPSTVLSVDEFANLGWIHASASAVAVFNDLRYEDASEYLEPLVDLQLPSLPNLDFMLKIVERCGPDEEPDELDDDDAMEGFDYGLSKPGDTESMLAADGERMKTAKSKQSGGEDDEEDRQKQEEDQDDSREVVLKKKKTKKELAQERLFGKEKGGIPAEIRKKMRDRVLAGRRTKKIDLCNLGLPYLPKMVTDEVSTEILLCDRNEIDEIPAPLGMMFNLSVLSLSYNRLPELPSFLWGLERMREFNVDNNQLEYIPKEIVAFSGLVTLKFHGNMLQRVEPAIGTITSIRKLTLDKNFLKDLPTELKNIPYMATLGLSHNLFEHIPDVVFTFKKLRSLMLQHNLIGFIPERFAIFKRLTDLNLSFNLLISIPSLFKDLTDLRRLHIDRNELYQFPTVVTGLTNLTDLSLVGNMIPNIPEDACGLFLLKRLRLGGNRLLDLPQQLTNLRSLTDLGLQNNALSVFAPHIGRMTHLTVLRVLGNKITTPFPQIVDRGTKPFLSFLRRLEKALDTGVLDLSKLKLTLYYHPAGVPKSILLTLKLNNNQLPTIDGSQFEDMVQLERLEIGDNPITEFPKEIGSFLTTLTSLDVKNCQVSVLPIEWQTLHRLTELDFSNCLIDQLPLEYGHLTSLQTLNWTGNYLKNPQPDILQQGVKFSVQFLMTILRCRDETPELNLQRHKLLTIPKILGTLSCLNSLRLDHNRLFFLPDFIGRFTMLRYLSLSCNYFRELPKTTRALTNLEYLDLHLNYFKEIPEIVSRCTGLVELNLSDNQVVTAPHYVAKLTRLTSLNLDNNCIMTLPTEWYVLTNLKFLGLRNNLLRLPLKSLCDNIDPGVCLEFLARLHEAETTNVINFSGRPYKFFPGELCRLTNLTDLRLQRYQMSYLSYTISTLTKLLHVELDHNQMETLPPAFSKLHLMQFFSMSYNKLFMPPVCMASLTSLQRLDLSHNMMTAFSDEIAALTMLRALIINNNQIFRLPSNIGSCDALEILDAHSNQLTDLPPSLVNLKHVTHLLLSDNYITELPLCFCLFQDSSLLEIDVSDNGVSYPPKRWWSRGLRASWSYMRRFYDALDPKQTTLDMTCLDLCVVPAQAFDVIQKKSSLYFRSSLIGIPSTTLVVDPETDADLGASDVAFPTGAPLLAKPGAVTQKSTRVPSFTTRDASQVQAQTSEPNSAPPEIKEDDVPYLKQLIFPPPSTCGAWGMGLPVPFVTVQAPFEKKDDKVKVEEKKGGREKTLPAPPATVGRGKDAKSVSPLKKRKVEEEEVILARTRPERILLPTGGGVMWGAAGVDDLHLLERDERPIASSKLPVASTTASKKKSVGDSPTKRQTAEATAVAPVSVPDLYRVKLAPYVDPCPIQNLLLGNNPRLSFLPVWTGQCTALTRLSVRYTSCTVLPYYLGWLTTLTEIDFAGCDVTRPDVIIQQRGTLAMLQYMRQIDSALWTKELDLSGQDFTYIPLEVCDLTMLTNLSLNNNRLSNIPSQISNLSKLVKLEIQYNSIDSLPESFSHLHLLKVLDAKHNLFTAAEDCLGGCTSLQQLRMHENPLQRVTEGCSKWSRMMDLRLFDDDIGILPDGVGGMVYLPKLRLSYNRLSHLPETIGKCRSLRELVATHNNITELPPSIGHLTHLYRLRLGFNELTALPPCIGDIVSLTELTFDNNKITVLPPELGLLTNLRTLIFGNNDIVDPPPSVLIKGTKAIVSYLFRMYEARGAPREIVLRGKNAVENFHELLNQATQLHSLSLRCKTLDDVPKQVPLLTSLTWLELSVNFIHTLPPSMGDLLQLTHLDISYNELPDIPESLASLRQMDFARMSFNFFSFVPTCVFSWGRLRTLYIDNNEIREVEDDIGRLTSLELLNMNNNQIRRLCPGFCRLTSLNTLSVEANAVITFPPEFGNLHSLQVLKVGANVIEEFPPSFSALQELRVLHAQCNRLTQGDGLPVEMLPVLSQLILTDNNIKRIPPEWYFMTALTVLHLGNNSVPLEPECQFMDDPEDIRVFLRRVFILYCGTQRAAKVERLLRARRQRLQLRRKNPGASFWDRDVALSKEGAGGDDAIVSRAQAEDMPESARSAASSASTVGRGGGA